MEYDKDYYEDGVATGKSCYENYRWLPELTLPLAHEIVTQLGIGKDETILDYGCAKGYLVKALRMLNYNAWGCDISEYAINSAPEDTKKYLALMSGSENIKGRYDWIIAKDVLEHVDDVDRTLKDMKVSCGKLCVIVPLARNGKYIEEMNEKDITHKIRWDLPEWCDALDKAGFNVESAKTDMPHIKESHRDTPDSFGFIIGSTANEK